MAFRSSSVKTPCPICGRTSTGCRMGKTGELLLCRLGNTCDPRNVHPGLKVGAVVEGNWACVEIDEGNEYAAFKQHEEPVEIGRTKYSYYDVHGGSIIKTRIDYSNGKKEFRSQSYKIEDLLPYKYETLGALSPGDSVFVVEGEKTCDAMRGCGFNSVALPGANYQPRELAGLRDKMLIWCPDRDRKGVECMLRWAKFYETGQWLLAEPHNEAAWRDPNDGVGMEDWLPDVTDLEMVMNAVRSDPPVLPVAKWYERLELGNEKMQAMHPYDLSLKLSEQLGEALCYNELFSAIELDGERLEDEGARCAYIKFGAANVKVEKYQAIDVLLDSAMERSYHPVRNYLNTCTDPLPDEMWANIGGEFLGGEPDEYDNSIVRRWLIHAVKRAYEPGSVFGLVLVLVGRQEAGKSRFFEELCGKEWFNDGFKVTGDQADDIQSLRQSWIAEWGELDGGMRKNNEADIKAFISRKVDRTREAYGQGTSIRPRGFVICGTTNKESGFFSDETGNRRFALYNVGSRIDCEKVVKWRDRIWASAVRDYRNGVSIHLNETERAVQEDRNRLMFREDPWAHKISEYLTVRRHLMEVTTHELLTNEECLGNQVGRLTTYDQQRVKAILTAMGWKEGRKMISGVKKRVFRRPGYTG